MIGFERPAVGDVTGRLREGLLDTFLRLGVEPVLRWDFAPRRPRFLHRLLHHSAVPWLAVAYVFGIVAGASSQWSPWPVLLGVVAAAPLALARWDPLLGWRAALVVTAVAGLWPGAGAPPLMTGTAIGLPIFTFYVALTYRRDIAMWAWAATILAVTPVLETTLAVTVSVGTLLVLLTDALRSRRLASIALADQEEITGVERARRISVEERARVARELHDIVAHHMSMVAVRAETAPFRLPDLPEKARAEFIEISQAARESLNEIRGLLNVLRSEKPPLVPQPGLGQVEALVEGARRAGVDVELTVRGEPRPLRAAVELCAYRILQESLSNVSRHAPGSVVQVWIEYGVDTLEMMVANSGGPQKSRPGHGITGMAERVTAVGGSIDARRRADGRFVVEATLPVGS